MTNDRDTFHSYLSQLGRYPLLSADEERELARRVRDEDDGRAAKRLITANLRFVVKVAAEYRRYDVPFQDLVQEGNLGLMRAVEKFDPDRGVRLTTYAAWWIRAYIQAFILRTWSMVRIGTTRADRKVFFGLSQARAQTRRKSPGEAEDVSALAKQLGLAVEELTKLMQRVTTRDVSLDAPISETGDDHLVDFVRTGDPTPEDELTARETQSDILAKIDAALDRLTERQRYVLQSRALSDEPMYLWQIGDELSLTRERVRQIEAKALRRLGTALQEITPREERRRERRRAHS